VLRIAEEAAMLTSEAAHGASVAECHSGFPVAIPFRSLLQVIAMRRIAESSIRTLFLAAALCSPAAAENWPRFRGPHGDGTSDLKGVPTAWTVNDYEWVIELPGVGHSSPVVWDQSLFVTSATEEGERTLFCLNADTGKEIWRHSASLGKNHLHQMNSYASASPVVDADCVYVTLADADHYTVTALTHEGTQVWTRDLGPCATEHGHGVSPILYENLVIVANDQAKAKSGASPPSAIIALNAKDGEIVWRAERPSRDASYATPIVITPQGAPPQLVCLSGACGLTALDPLTGKEIWTTGEMPLRTVSSPVYVDGLVFATCGQGGKGELLLCVDPSGRGDISATHIRYSRKREIPYVPTPVGRDDVIYLWVDDGTFFSVDAQTGKNIAKQRIGGNFFSSPVMIDGKIYGVSHDGEIVVVDTTGPELKVLGRNPLDDSAYASPAVANGRVYFRGFHKLACLKSRS
jgi:outer membrane protein assembly factor BamB